MNRCDQCRHWDASRAFTTPRRVRLGACDKALHVTDCDGDPQQMMFVSDPDMQSATLWTADNFSCAHFDQRQS
jgi:hypothetical protein